MGQDLVLSAELWERVRACFSAVLARCAGRCPLWHGGDTSNKIPSGAHVPVRPREPRDGSVPVARGCSRLAQCPGRPGLALRQGRGECRPPQCNSPCVRAGPWTRSATPSSSSSSAPPPPRCMPGERGCSPTGLLFLQAGPCHGKGSLWALGDTSNPPSKGAELPELCQRRLLLWETTSCQGRNLAGLQTSTGATGISLQRLVFYFFFPGDLFPGLES